MLKPLKKTIDRKSFFSGLQRVVIKIGTNLLTDNGYISTPKFNKVVEHIITLKSYVKDVVVVSSGAIGAGYKQIIIKDKGLTIPIKQASASIGQVILMNEYMNFFKKKGYIASQILLTDPGLSDRTRYVNAKNTLNTLLQYKNVIPVVNENDTVAVDEIKFGDNDKLAALVASLIDANLLILLSDVNGLYYNYNSVKDRTLISEVPKITKIIEQEAKQKGSSFSTGGMTAKLQAAKITTNYGITTLIANGTQENIINNIFNGNNVGTIFLPINKAKSSKIRWLHLNSKAKGKIYIDDNAVKAITQNNKSLLPKGIINVISNFNEFDIVEILNRSDNVIAKGISYYSCEEILKIKGFHSSEIENILGYSTYEVVVHKDNLAVI